MGFQRIERLERALVHSKGPEGMVGCPFPLLGRPMPHKHNADRRHHIPKMAFKVQNWPEYEAGLRRRGSLTLWIEDAALESWQTCGPGGQARYVIAVAGRRPKNSEGNYTTSRVWTTFSYVRLGISGLKARR